MTESKEIVIMPYDVVQVYSELRQEWLDYATIRTVADYTAAVAAAVHPAPRGRLYRFELHGGGRPVRYVDPLSDNHRWHTAPERSADDALEDAFLF